MKVKVFLIVAFCCLSVVAFSQKAGVKGGVNFTNLYVDDVDDENMKIGFNAGAYYRAQLADGFGIQPELLFSQKGTEVEYTNTKQIISGTGKYRFNLNYLEVPVLLVGSFGSFNIHAGPYIGFLLGVKIKDVDDDGDVSAVEELDRDDFNTVDAGLAGGIGFDFSGGMIGARYNYGLNEIAKSGSVAGNPLRNSKNSALQLYVGFDF